MPLIYGRHLKDVGSTSAQMDLILKNELVNELIYRGIYILYN